MSDDLLGALVLAVIVAILVGAPLACSMNDNATIAEMVKAGAHPVDAKCAVKSGGSTECLVRAAMKEPAK